MILMNMMLILFPILIYLVLSCYNLLFDPKISKLIFVVTMCSSLYLSLYFYTFLEEKSILLLFCNIPTLICYFKKDIYLAVTFSIIIIFISYYKYDSNMYVLIIKYLSYFVTYLVLYNKKEFDYLFLKIIAIIQGFFVSFEYFFVDNVSVSYLFKIIIYTIMIYGITFVSLYLFKLSDKISGLYLTIEQIDKEKKLKDSLFKLTHEIKNPIAVCKGYLDMMNLDNKEKTRKYIDIIKSEIDRSLNIMNEYTDYSKIKIEKDYIDLSMLLDEIYESFNVLLTDKKIKFIYNNTYDDLYINGDYNRLKQVFVNVIKNSIESITTSGIIEIEVKVIDKKISVIIKDDGVGMTTDELENIKKMFFTTKKDGTGLGVALSNEIVEAHNGNLTYESKKDMGTICTIMLQA